MELTCSTSGGTHALPKGLGNGVLLIPRGGARLLHMWSVVHVSGPTCNATLGSFCPSKLGSLGTLNGKSRKSSATPAFIEGMFRKWEGIGFRVMFF